MNKIKVVQQVWPDDSYKVDDIMYVRWTKGDNGSVHASHEPGPGLTEEECVALGLPYLPRREFVYLAHEPDVRTVSVPADTLLKVLYPGDYPDDAGEAHLECRLLLLGLS